ncbi:MAG: glycosyltransferase [Mycoplasmatales bacterium]
MRTIKRVINHDYKMYYLFLKAKLASKEEWNSFVIITSTYNCAEYLPKFFYSIFSNNYPLELIKIIIVNDGSMDTTEKVIGNWQRKYSQNIVYLKQANQGQASARNLGLEYWRLNIKQEIANEFITFIDSDDFVGENYFAEVNKSINHYTDVNVFTTRWKFFFETDSTSNYNHPLDYRFRNRLNYTKKNLLENSTYFVLSMSSTFFRASKLLMKFGKGNTEMEGLKVREIKPQFEDAFFVNEFLLRTGNYNCVFINSTDYYYVRRKNANSTLNLARNQTSKYTSLLQNGYLQLLQEFASRGSIPDFIQQLVLYDLSWNIKEFTEYAITLTELQLEQRSKAFAEIFRLISLANLRKSANYLWNYYQIGLEARYYLTATEDLGTDLLLGALYENFHFEDQTQYLFHTAQTDFEVFVNNRPQKDLFVIDEELNGTFFVKRILFTVPMESKVHVKIGTKKFFPKRIAKRNKVKLKLTSVLLFFDRIAKADDNAEVLYLEMAKKYPNSYFIIDEDCPDFERLRTQGVKVVGYGTAQFVKLYYQADFIFSSSVDPEIENFQKLRHNTSSIKARFIFLQHGVITDDLSSWLCRKKIDKMVISAYLEQKVCLKTLPFIQTQYLETGLPRFDRLAKTVQLEKKQTNYALIHFTWRQKLKEEDLENSEYAQELIQVINVVAQSGLTPLVILHPQASSLKKIIEKKTECLVYKAQEIIYREQLLQAKLLITDYSSIFADMVYLKKPVIFFQSNPQQFYANHLYTQAIDYKVQAPGVVVESLGELENRLTQELAIVEDFFFENKNGISNCEKLIQALKSIYE